ncbi:hypothetical protein KSP39_PZI007396 [Platanthera zijinensis]|uniref:DDE Tnp4 domain-containing protein n=1 Tax=Platanthera zijinensis TaxID=2320716 RepID=A0AAP0BQH3_9ASPA
MFNHAHSSLRSVIERSFGVWKKKWAILRDMPSYSFDKQARIVIATMTLHNFIRRHPSRVDIDFIESEQRDPCLGMISQRREEDCSDTAAGVEEMIALRDIIADQVFEART